MVLYFYFYYQHLHYLLAGYIYSQNIVRVLQLGRARRIRYLPHRACVGAHSRKTNTAITDHPVEQVAIPLG